MKFKAVFSDRGLRTLEKGFGPTFEKFGKTCQILLGSEDVHIIQTGVNTDGVHVTARLGQVAWATPPPPPSLLGPLCLCFPSAFPLPASFSLRPAALLPALSPREPQQPRGLGVEDPCWCQWPFF